MNNKETGNSEKMASFEHCSSFGHDSVVHNQAQKMGYFFCMLKLYMAAVTDEII